jgi:dynein assembly factor 1
LNCPEGFVDVFKPMKKLNALKLTGNPVVSKMKSFRKTMITQVPQLSYLDRPIFEAELVGAKAWAEGGHEAEVAAKEKFKSKKYEEDRRQMNEFRAWQKKVRARKQKELEERKKLDPSAVATYGVQENGVGEFVKQQAYEPEPDEDALRAAEEERALVTGDGVLKMGQNFWAHGNPELQFDEQGRLIEENKPEDPPPLEELTTHAIDDKSTSITNESTEVFEVAPAPDAENTKSAEETIPNNLPLPPAVALLEGGHVDDSLGIFILICFFVVGTVKTIAKCEDRQIIMYCIASHLKPHMYFFLKFFRRYQIFTG